MADVNANIGVHIDTSEALAQLKNLQRQLSVFHQSIAKGSAASALAQKNLQTNLLNTINATGQFTARMGLVRTSTESFTHALEKNKLGMREYFRYSGAATKTFGKLFKSEFDTLNKVAEDRVKKMQTQYIKMGRDASGAMRAMSITPNTLNMKDYGTQAAIAAQKQALFNQLVRQGSTNLLNFGKNTQWAGRQLMVGFTVPLLYIGGAAAKVFMDLEKQAIKFKRVYGDAFTTADETNKALADIQKLAEGFTKYGVAVKDTMEMAATAAAMGKKGAELTAQVAEATRLAVLGGVEQQQALETTISVTNAFGIAAEDLAKKVDFLNAVENQTVVSIEDLTVAIPKAGPVVKQLGGNVEDLAFFLTAMKEGGINASEGANALKSGLASLINPTKKASEMLAGMGVNITGIVEANKGNIKETVIDFARALDTLDPLNRARAIEQLFGKFQFARLSTLFQNITKEGTQASKVLDLAGASVEELAILSERELKTVENAIGTNFKKSIEDLKLTLAPIGKEFLKAVTPIIKVISQLFEKFDGLSEGTKKFLIVATTLTGVVGPILLMTFGLLANGTANIIKLFLALRTGFLKLSGNSSVLAQQTNYLTAEQLEAETVAASLNQAHTRLTQSFNVETAAVNALRNAYIEATTAATRFAAANPGMMVPGFGKQGVKGFKGPKKFKRGATYVPGSGNEDTVPSMLTPGEAVIPAGVAQDPKYKPIINAMVNGKLQGFIEGTGEVRPASIFGANAKQFEGVAISPTGGRSLRGTIGGGDPLPELTSEEIATKNAIALARIQRSRKAREEAARAEKRSTKDQVTHVGKGKSTSIAKILQNPNLTETTRSQLQAYQLILRSQGLPEATVAHHQLAFDFPAWMNRDMPTAGVPAQEFLDEWKKRGPGKWNASKITAVDAKPMDDAFIKVIQKDIDDGRKIITDSYIDEIFNTKVANEPGVSKSKGFTTALEKYSDIKTYNLGAGTSDNPEKARKILQNAVDKGYIKDFSIVERFSESAGKVKVGSSTVTLNDGTVVNMNRFGGGARQGISTKKNPTPYEIANAKAGDTSELKLKEIDKRVKASKFGKLKPTNFGNQLQPTSGHSFPVPGIGGIYEKPDGTRVFVKPMMDDVAALAEVRATQIARDVHGLEAPTQTIKTMLDPTDPKGKRKIIVLESAFDPKFAPAIMGDDFTQEQYFRQLVAANLRGDKDLGRGNLGGNILADVGTAGVFEKASGDRVITSNIRSMAEQARINLLGVKGGAKKFFAEATAKIPANMTPDQYHAAMIKEIDTVLPKLEKTIAGFDLTDSERPVYQAMINRLKEGRNVDWREFYKIHSSVLTSKDESLQDKKTGKITPIKGKAKPRGVKPSSGKVEDQVLTTIPKGKKVVKTPKAGSRRVGKIVVPGLADASGATGYIDPKLAKEKVKELKIIKARNIADERDRQFKSEQNSLRRQSQKLEKERNRQLRADQKYAQKAAIMKSQYNQRGENLSKTPPGRSPADINAERSSRSMMRMQGVGMAAGMVATGAYMSGHAGIGNALMGLSVFATLIPMLASPMAAAVVGLTAVTASIVMLRKTFDKAQDETMKMTEAIGSGNNAMVALSEFAKTVTANEIMNRRRQGLLNPFAIQTGKTTFGENFVKSETGKSTLSNLGKSIKEGDGQQAQQQLLTQMISAVASGALDPSQARSIVASLGKELGDYSLSIKVNAQLNEILGPNGENLAKYPLGIRLKLVNESRKELGKQTALMSGVAPGALTRTQSNAQMLGLGGVGAIAGGSLAAGALAGATAGTVVPVIGTAIGAAIGATIAAGVGYFAQKGQQEKLGRASGANIAMQKMALEQSQQMQDSLKLEYDQRIANAKAAGDTAKATELQGKYEKANARLLAANGKLVTDIQNSYKKSSGAVKGALETGLDKQITNKYKGTALADIAPLATDLVSGSKMSKEQQFTIKMQMASGQMDPMQIVNLMEVFGKDQGTLTKVMNIVTKFGGTTANSAVSLANLFVDSTGKPVKSVQTRFIAALEGQTTSEGAQKILEFYAKVAQTGNVVNTAVIVDMLLKNPPLAEDLMTKIDAIVALKGPITVEALIKILNADQLAAVNEDMAYFTTLSDEQKKVYLQTLVTTITTVSKDDPAFKNWLESEGKDYKDADPLTQVREYSQYNAQRVTKGFIADNKTFGTPAASKGSGQRDTTFDDLLNSLKRTRDSRINAKGGAAELKRILSGKKDITIFAGIDQQLSKLKANTDFVDWIGGLDDAVRNKLITVSKAGVVALTELGNAAKKAFDEKQLGLYSAKAIDAVNVAKAQRDSFIKLSNAGLDVASTLGMIEDGNLANAIANAKNTGEVKKLIAQEKEKNKQQQITSALTDPTGFLKDINAELSKQYDFQRKIMELEKTRAEAKISGDYIGAAIAGQQQLSERAAFAGDITDLTGKQDIMQQAISQSTSIKDIALRARTQATLSQGLLGLKQLGSFNPTFGYSPQFAGINPSTAFNNGPAGAANNSSSVYNIQMTVNGNNATSDDIANQVIKKINLVAQRNNKTNAVGR
jgi:TP901 family phage tail tape measure protein